MLIKLEGTCLYLYNPKPFPTRKGLVNPKPFSYKENLFMVRNLGQIKPNNTVLTLIPKTDSESTACV